MELGWAKAIPVQGMVPIPKGEGPAFPAAAGAPVCGTWGGCGGVRSLAQSCPALSCRGRPALPGTFPVSCRCSSSALCRTGLVAGPGRVQGRVPEAISVSVPDKQMEAALSYYPGAKRERLKDVFSWLISGCSGSRQQQDVFLGWQPSQHQLWIVSAPRRDQVPGNRSDIRC